MEQSHRRPIAARNLALSYRCTDWLVMIGASPNGISVTSAVFGIGAGVAYAATAVHNTPWLWLLGALLVLLRLLANMFDGMVAVQTGTSTAVGELYNEVPDRVSDTAIFLGVGYAAGGSPLLGFLAALAAMGTAYIRAVGKAAGAHSEFCGPMAKQQRMALIIGLSAVAAAAPQLSLLDLGLAAWVLGVILVLSLVTIVRRTVRIARTLNAARSQLGGGLGHE